MIVFNQEYHLGRTAFFLLLSRRSAIALAAAFIGCLIGVFGQPLIQSPAGLIGAGGQNPIIKAAVLLPILNYAIAFFFLFAIAAFLIGFAVSALEYKNYSFTFTEFSLVLKRGILNKREISVPYRQIQNVDIMRSLGHQILGLSKVHIDAAGHEENGQPSMSEIVLEPIDKELAEEIRAKLQREIGVQVVETVQQADKESGIGNADNPQATGDEGRSTL